MVQKIFSESVNGRTIAVDFDSNRVILEKRLREVRSNTYFMVYHYWYEMLDKDSPHLIVFWEIVEQKIAKEIIHDSERKMKGGPFINYLPRLNTLELMYGTQTIMWTLQTAESLLSNAGRREVEYRQWNDKYNSEYPHVHKMMLDQYYHTLYMRMDDIVRLEHEYINSKIK